jgi:hypothetical protein
VDRGKYILLNTAVLGVIVLAAVMIWVGVGAIESTKALAVAIICAAAGLFIIGTIADAARKPSPSGWVRCNDVWIDKHGKAACATSPKIRTNRLTGSHYHPNA